MYMHSPVTSGLAFLPMIACILVSSNGYTMAFAASAALFGLGTVLAIVLLPSRQRLQQLRNAATAATVAPAGETDTVSSAA